MSAPIPNLEQLPLGSPLPPGDSHAISVQLPTWADTIGWAQRDPRVLDAMKTGYPRFFIPRSVNTLCERLLGMLEPEPTENLKTRMALAWASLRHALYCVRFLRNNHTALGHESGVVRLWRVSWTGGGRLVGDENKDLEALCNDPEPSEANYIGEKDIYLMTFPEKEMFALGKAAWQHSGFGISSRRAQYWLDHAPFLTQQPKMSLPSAKEIDLRVTHARTVIRRRIAAAHSTPSLSVSEYDVYLFPTGMTSIAEASLAALSLTSNSSTYKGVAIYGFPYVDTYKLLSVFFSHPTILYKPSPSDLSSLLATASSSTPFRMMVTEFPGNPLLQSPPLRELYSAARKAGFPVIVDDTVGTSANLAVLSACDVVCTSLTKMFSGGCNVMGGAVVISQQSAFHTRLKARLEKVKGEGDSAWFWQDVLQMEENSRDFVGRVKKAGENAARMVRLLRNYQRSETNLEGIVEEVYYPWGSGTQHYYDEFLRPLTANGTLTAANSDSKLPDKDGDSSRDSKVDTELTSRNGYSHGSSLNSLTDSTEHVPSGYGFLLSFRLSTPILARAFYDALSVAKGPSLGTNFTLCCAYTLLAHYKELEWAAGYGVVEDLVRVSVGVEEWDWLKERVSRALETAKTMAGKDEDGAKRE